MVGVILGGNEIEAMTGEGGIKTLCHVEER
jgi:hypothetical protein